MRAESKYSITIKTEDGRFTTQKYVPHMIATIIWEMQIMILDSRGG